MTSAPRVDEPDSPAHAATTDPDRGLSAADVDDRVARGEVNTTDQASSRSAVDHRQGQRLHPVQRDPGRALRPRPQHRLGRRRRCSASSSSSTRPSGSSRSTSPSGSSTSWPCSTSRPPMSCATGSWPRSRPRTWCWATSSSCGPGTRCPRTATCTRSSGLEVDESNLTGESDPVPKQDTRRGEVGHDRRGGAGSVRRRGGRGADSYANPIAAQAKTFTRTHSEIQYSVNRLLKYITWVIVAGAAAADLVADQGLRRRRLAHRHRPVERRARRPRARGPRAPDVGRLPARGGQPVAAAGARPGAARPSRASPGSTSSASTRPAPSPSATSSTTSCRPVGTTTCPRPRWRRLWERWPTTRTPTAPSTPWPAPYRPPRGGTATRHHRLQLGPEVERGLLRRAGAPSSSGRRRCCWAPTTRCAATCRAWRRRASVW